MPPMILGTAVNRFSERAVLLDYLELTNAQLAHNEQHIAKQKQLVDQLSGDGRAVSGAKQLLRALQMIQTAYESHRIRLEQELTAANPK